MKKYKKFVSIIFCTTGFAIIANAQNDTVQNHLHYDLGNKNIGDTIFKYAKNFPENTKLSVAFIDGNDVKTIGAIKQNNIWQNHNNADSVFAIGSITKVFTATLLARAVINHQVSLDETVDKILGYPLKDNIKITLKELANHTSGLPRLSNTINSRDDSNPYADYTSADLKRDLTDSLKMDNEPNKVSSYSNFGVGLLGYLLSLIEHESYEEMLQQQIFEQLKMNRSTINREKIKKYLVKGLNETGDSAKLWDFAPINQGMGSIYSTVNDLAKFVIENFRHNEINTLLHEPTFKINNVWSMGLIWNIYHLPERTLYWHNGAVEGYRACLEMDLKTKKAVIVLSNVSAYNTLNTNIDNICVQLLNVTDK